MLNVRYAVQFKKDVKLAKERGKDLSKLKNVIEKLVNEETLPAEYRDHSLIGNWKSFRECHIEPDWLLIYRINSDEVELIAQRTGTHADLYKK